MLPKTKYVKINPRVLNKIRMDSGYNVETVSKRAGVKKERYYKWENEFKLKVKDLPTIRMLVKIAELFQQPLMLLLSEEIPDLPKLPIKDYRKSYKNQSSSITPETKKSIRKIIWYQKIIKNLLNEFPSANKFIDYNVKNIGIDDVVSKLRHDAPIQKQFDWKDKYFALKQWRLYLENKKGLFTFQLPLEKEVRGFSLYNDDYPSIIVLNSSDTTNGKIFTLFHEYYHILLKQSGICYPGEDKDQEPDNDIEKRCNYFSGSFLVPKKDFLNKYKELNNSNDIKKINKLVKKFKVSHFVILHRLYQLELISSRQFHQIYQELNKYKNKPEIFRGSHENIYSKKIISRHGSRFVYLTIQAVETKKLSTIDATQILGIKSDGINRYNKLVNYFFEEALK